ncbi:MAG TPA: hypothetical protein VKZ59_13720 [Acidobacteriota bacterium]|nr:hypothetical protein [Acidobacteriota bacterium]
MNTNKFLLASLGAAVFLMLYGWAVYGVLLADYVARLSPEGTMLPPESQSIGLILLGCLVQGLGLTWIFIKGYQGRGPIEGVRFGLFLGVFLLGMYLVAAGVSPMTLRAAVTFAIIDAVMYMGAGIVIAFLYKKQEIVRPAGSAV